jgi:hypothetical protein
VKRGNLHPGKAKVTPEEKVSSPEPSNPARFPSTHAEHAAMMAEVLRACVIAIAGEE